MKAFKKFFGVEGNEEGRNLQGQPIQHLSSSYSTFEDKAESTETPPKPPRPFTTADAAINCMNYMFTTGKKVVNKTIEKTENSKGVELN